jgi:hypothetical protein
VAVKTVSVAVEAVSLVVEVDTRSCCGHRRRIKFAGSKQPEVWQEVGGNS